MRIVATFMTLASIRGLYILQPAEFAGELKHTEAVFGSPKYGGSITGKLFYFPSNSQGCTPLDRNLIPPESTLGPTIVLLDRGNCSFVQKVRDAQSVSVDAVIVADNHIEKLQYMADDGTGASISTPAIFISYESGQTLKKALVLSGNAAGEGSDVIVKLSWSIPDPDNHVEWSFWTSSNDAHSLPFIRDMKAPALALGDHTSFAPHFQILDGHNYHCTRAAPWLDTGYICNKQCTNQGRYCAVDPEHDQKRGMDGEDVVKENLRQICIFEQANNTHHTEKWWNYALSFAQNCSHKDATFNNNCSMRVQQSVGLDPALTNKCVQDSGGYESNSGPNTLLDAEMGKRLIDHVFILPSVKINNRDYHGKLSCPTPYSISTCPILAAICDGFLDGTEPPVCKSDYCWGRKDICGVCDGDGKSCLGCDGVPNSGKVNDACGHCGGDGKYDQCGACLSPSSPGFGTTCLGCDGVLHSGKVQDKCNVCGGDQMGTCTKTLIKTEVQLFGLTVTDFDENKRDKFKHAISDFLNVEIQSILIENAVNICGAGGCPPTNSRRQLSTLFTGSGYIDQRSFPSGMTIMEDSFLSGDAVSDTVSDTYPTAARKLTGSIIGIKVSLVVYLRNSDRAQNTATQTNLNDLLTGRHAVELSHAIQASSLTMASPVTLQEAQSDSTDADAPSGPSVALIAGLASGGAVLLAVIAVVVRMYVKRREQHMRNDMMRILERYVPLEEGQSSSGGTSFLSSNKDRESAQPETNAPNSEGAGPGNAVRSLLTTAMSSEQATL